MQKLSPYMVRTDPRGSFLGITQQPWAEINFIETTPFQKRGGHYHQRTQEVFFIISGEIEISVENIHTGQKWDFIAQKGDLFLIEPYELHTFYTRTQAQWINFLSHKMDTNAPDFYTLPAQA